jgi:dephospho-CoA kinase
VRGASALGLTGGIGSGKSTVAKMLAVQGAALIDADAIARSVTAPGGAAMPAIAQQFGAHLSLSRRARSRARCARWRSKTPQRAKHDSKPSFTRWSGRTDRQAQQALDSGRHLLVFDIPLLVESGRWRGQGRSRAGDRLRAADPDRRVMARSGLTREAIQIIAAQAHRARNAWQRPTGDLQRRASLVDELERARPPGLGATLRAMIAGTGRPRVILYEYPFNERIRTYLRLEHLFGGWVS